MIEDVKIVIKLQEENALLYERHRMNNDVLAKKDAALIEIAQITAKQIAKMDIALLECIETLKYYASVCGEDDQQTPAKTAITRAQGALNDMG